MKNTVFAKELCICNGREEANNAWNLGESVFNAALNTEYKSVLEEQLITILKNNISKTNQHGLIDLCPGVPTDREARVFMWYMPTYANLAALVYLKLNNPQLFDKRLDIDFARMMEVAFKYNIVGHGFDAPKTARETMLMFARAGAKDFIEKYPVLSPNFTRTMNGYIDRYREILKQEGTEDGVYKDNAFNNEPENNLLRPVLAAWDGKPHAIFVYGTLKQNGAASDFMRDAEYAGRFVLNEYAMYDLGSYPGIKARSGEQVVGEVYYVTDELKVRLDAYEGEGTLYKREIVNVKNAYGPVNAEAYVYIPEVSDDKVRAEWGVSEDTEVWYAAYGSNISEERFKYYIEGGQYQKNGKVYEGCHNKAQWKESMFKAFSGELYFGNVSSTWSGNGVAFYDPTAYGKTYMRLYKITWGQLLDIQKQECDAPNWYSKRHCLGVLEDGIAVYTITSENRREINAPSDEYVEVVKQALIEECGVAKKEAETYLNKAKGLKKKKPGRPRKEIEKKTLEVVVNNDKRAVLNTTIHENVMENFKRTCKEQGVKMNFVLEEFMRGYIEGKYKAKVVQM